MAADEGRLTAEAVGEIVDRDGTLVVDRIHVVYSLALEDEERREEARRVRKMHAEFCPVARTLEGCVDITTELQFR